jgi:hypothetical protein
MKRYLASVLTILTLTAGITLLASPAHAEGPGIKPYWCVDAPGAARTQGLAAADYAHDVYGLAWAVNAPHAVKRIPIPSCSLGVITGPWPGKNETEIAVYRWVYGRDWVLCGYNYFGGSGNSAGTSLAMPLGAGQCAQANYPAGLTWVFTVHAYYDGYGVRRELRQDWKTSGSV